MRPYILCYFVFVPEWANDLVTRIKKRLGYKVVNIMLTEESASIGDVKIRDAGPEEFIGLFRSAAFVVTSSFHGTIFSLLYKVCFVTVLYQSTASRVENLLKSVNLTSRIVKPEDNIDAMVKDERDSLFTNEVQERIENLRKSGMRILQELINS